VSDVIEHLKNPLNEDVLTDLNKACEKYFGKKDKEIIGKTDFELMPKDVAEGCRRSDIKALKSGGVVVTEEVVDNTEQGDILEIDLGSGTITNLTRKHKFTAKPYPEFMAKLIAAGGLIEYTKQRLATRRI